jgi:hypothetical protein
MYVKAALIGAIVAASAVPAMAAEYYVVHDKKAKKCMVVEKKPTVETTVVVGDKVFTSQTEAEVKTITVCKDL